MVGAGDRPVVFLVSHSSPGGVQELWINLSEGLKARGYDARAIALYPHSSDEALDSRWSFVVPARPRSIMQALGLARALYRLFRRERPQAVVTAMPAANVLASLVANFAANGTRVMISHHSPAETHNPVLNAADALTGTSRAVKSVVSVSQAVSDSLAAKPVAYLNKRRVIRNALSPEISELLTQLREARANRVIGRTVVAAGRLAPQKNYPMLLRALQQAVNVRAHIVGDGADRAMLVELAGKLDVTSRVQFCGLRPRTETLRILADGDVFVQPSLYEGHSLAVLEAANLDLPIVVSRVPAQVEAITASDGTQCGIVVELDDDAALAQAIRRLLDDEAAYLEWQAKARHLAQSNTYDDMISAYERLISK